MAEDGSAGRLPVLGKRAEALDFREPVPSSAQGALSACPFHRFLDCRNANLTWSKDIERRSYRGPFAIYLVNRNFSYTQHDQIGVDPVPGKVRYLGSAEPQFHPAYRSAFSSSGSNNRNPGLTVATVRRWGTHIHPRGSWRRASTKGDLRWHHGYCVRLRLGESTGRIKLDHREHVISQIQSYRLIERRPSRLHQFFPVSP